MNINLFKETLRMLLKQTNLVKKSLNNKPNIMLKIDLYAQIHLVNKSNVNCAIQLHIIQEKAVLKIKNLKHRKNVDTVNQFLKKDIPAIQELKHLMIFATKNNVKSLPKMLVQKLILVNTLVQATLNKPNVCLV